MFNWNWNSSNTWDWDQRYDWEELKKQGRVTEKSEEKDGFKTVTKTFISFDGKTQICVTESEPIINEIQMKIKDIDKKIQKAVSKENFEEAARLKKEKETILNKQTK